MYPKLTRMVWSAVLGAAFAAFAAAAHAGDIKVLSDSPLQPALTKVADLFRQETHNQVMLVFDPSPAVKKRIEDGEAADVVIVQPDFVDELTRAGKVTPETDRSSVASVSASETAAAVRCMTFRLPDKLRETLLGADTLVFNNVASGNTFAKALEKLGIAETLKAKIVRTSPNGIFDPVLKGKGNDFVAGTTPLIATTPGIKLLGPLPGDLQNYLVYTAVLMVNASQRETAQDFIKFLTSSKARDAFAANGVN